MPRTQGHMMLCVPINQPHESVEEAVVSYLGVCGHISGHAFGQSLYQM